MSESLLEKSYREFREADERLKAADRARKAAIGRFTLELPSVEFGVREVVGVTVHENGLLNVRGINVSKEDAVKLASFLQYYFLLYDDRAHCPRCGAEHKLPATPEAVAP